MTRLDVPQREFAFLTVTVAADDLHAGERVLTLGFAALRRRAAFTRAFAGGEQHLQVARCPDSRARNWNVHLHIVLERRPGADLPPEALAEAWASLLDRKGLRGSLDLRPATERLPRPRWARRR